MLDTHTLWWAFVDPAALGRSARDALTDGGNTVLVSAVSGYELAYKNRIGKLDKASVLLTALSAELVARRFGRLELTLDHALLGGRLDWSHRDPFDRLLVAQALADDLTLVSNERLFDATGVRRLW